MTSLLDAALKYAADGFFVFPTAPYGELNAKGLPSKEPKCPRGHLEATRDEAKIRSWWADNQNYNIGCSPAMSGHCVIDVDPPLGEQTLAALAPDFKCDVVMMTPRGGKHYWFSGQIRTTTGTNGLGEGLDTRGGFRQPIGDPKSSGFVVMPPSRLLNGDYKGTLPEPWAIPEVPSWISTKLAPREWEALARPAKIGDDEPQNIARAIGYLEGQVAKGNLASKGCGNSMLHTIALGVSDLAISQDLGVDLIVKHYNPYCLPPWDDPHEDETFMKPVTRGLKKEGGQNEAGAHAVKSLQESFGEIAATLKGEPEPEASRWVFLDKAKRRQLKMPSYLFSGVPEHGITLFYGAPGTMKSFIMADLAMRLATGMGGYGHAAGDPLPVVYFASESPEGMGALRIPAWEAYHGHIDTPDLLWMCPDIPSAGFPGEFEAAMGQMIAQIKGNPKVIILDTAIRAMSGMDMTNAKDVGLFFRMVETMRRTYNCAIWIVHHTGKDKDRGAYGSVMIEAHVNAMHEVVREPKSKYLVVTDKRQKETPEDEKGRCMKVVPFAGSAVLVECDHSEMEEARTPDDPYGRSAVGKALRAIGATVEEPVETDVLAAEMVKAMTGDYAKNKEKAARRLDSLSTTDKMKAYVIGGKWGLSS